MGLRQLAIDQHTAAERIKRSEREKIIAELVERARRAWLHHFGGSGAAPMWMGRGRESVEAKVDGLTIVYDHHWEARGSDGARRDRFRVLRWTDNELVEFRSLKSLGELLAIDEHAYLEACPHCGATRRVPLSDGLSCTNEWHSRTSTA